MEWLANNWIIIALGIAILLFYQFGRRFGGGTHWHGGGLSGRVQRPERPETEPSLKGAEPPTATHATAHAGHGDAPASEQRKRHRHGC